MSRFSIFPRLMHRHSITAPVRDSSGESGNFLGHQFEVALRYTLNRNFSFEGGTAILLKGEFLKDASDTLNEEPALYFYLQATIEF